jgi:outer membrane protein OmpA-like peptidoglycan-associated protein
MKKFQLLILLVFINFTQAQAVFSVYFEMDKFEAKPSEIKKLDDFLTLNASKIQKIVGICGFRGFNKHHEILALKRANYLADILKVKLNKSNLIVEANSEIFDNNSSKLNQRRVDIVYEGVIEMAKKEESTNESKIEKGITTGKVGDKIVLTNMNFIDGTDSFYPESKVILENLVDILKKNPRLRIEIQGHICCMKGQDPDGMALKRAMATYNYLTFNGIKPGRLKYKSFDATQPLFAIPEKNEEEKKANRRVEVMILSK